MHILSFDGVKISIHRVKREIGSKYMLLSVPEGILFKEGVKKCQHKKRISETNPASDVLLALCVPLTKSPASCPRAKVYRPLGRREGILAGVVEV